MMDFLRRIKWAYQRVVRGYDDTIMWGFAGYFHQFLDPMEKFCKQELDKEELMRLNPERKVIYEKTLDLMVDYRWDDSFQCDTEAEL